MPDEAEQTPEVRRFKSCVTKDCKAPPSYRFTWPGNDETGICAVCAVKAAGVAQAMGLHLQLIPLHANEIDIPGDDPATKEGDSDGQVPEGDGRG